MIKLEYSRVLLLLSRKADGKGNSGERKVTFKKVLYYFGNGFSLINFPSDIQNLVSQITREENSMYLFKLHKWSFRCRVLHGSVQT